MTASELHLTEEQRQRAADRTLAPDEMVAVSSHLRQCGTCAADVARLTQLVARARAARRIQEPPGDVWPSIRDRIERAKFVALPATPVNPTVRPARRRRAVGWLGAAAAAALALFALGRMSARFGGAPDVVATEQPVFANVADSSGTYKEQARVLLDRLSLQRAMLRPDALAAIDRDLRVVDSAIAELDVAVARAPNDPVLRRLLASSYREKVDILKRAGNAE